MHPTGTLAQEHLCCPLRAALRDGFRGGSCPELALLDVDAEHDAQPLPEETASPGSDAGDWFKSHVELIGAPRPLRSVPSSSADVRREAMKQLSMMTTRYPAEVDRHPPGDKVERHCQSSPDLLQWRPPTEKAPACPSCASPCASLRRLAAALRRESPKPAGGDAPAGGVPAFDAAESACIIFDWDDTLLPTTFLMSTVLPSLKSDDRTTIPADSPYQEMLRAHAHVVGFVLRLARKVARVAIVTNSLQPWVVASGARFLPGLDVESLLQELQIDVHYSRRLVPSIPVNLIEQRYSIELDRQSKGKIGLDIIPSDKGSLQIACIKPGGLAAQWNEENPDTGIMLGDKIVEVNGQVGAAMTEACRKAELLRIRMLREVPEPDPYTEAKRRDMDSCLGTFYAKPGWRWNVLSIGDSVQEQEALKQVLHSVAAQGRRPLCKTVNLLDGPTVEQLSMELRVLMVWLSRMVKYDKDFDLAMDKLDHLEKHLFQA